MLKGKRILIFVEDMYEDLELWYPKLRLIEEGATTVIAGPSEGTTYQGKHGYPCKADGAIDLMEETDFEGLVIPGGYAPDKLRRNEKVLQLTRQFQKANKLVAYICHAGWVPISAGIVKGYKVTSTPAIKDDLVNAGARWFDEPVVIDRNQVTSRGPSDLGHFCRAIIQVMNG